jgi:hypothetical protein
VQHLLVPTLTLALLGAIESLLCARVADQIAGLPRHDANQELMAQGVANMVTPFIGGLPVTGTIARTVTNVRAGASSPVAGLVHSVSLVLIVLHDLALADALAHEVWWMDGGQLRSSGSRQAVLREEALAEGFGVAFERVDGSLRPIVAPRCDPLTG